MSPPSRDLPLVAIGIAAAAVGVSLLVGGWGRSEQAPFPFVWRDVALVHFLAALPLAIYLAGSIRARVSVGGCLVLAAAALVLGLALWLVGDLFWTPLAAAGLRAALALLAALSAGMIAAAVGPFRERPPQGLGQALLALAILLAVPPFYLHARGKHDRQRLAELQDQSRLGEAQALAQAMLVLTPDARVRGKPLVLVAAELDRIVAELTDQAAKPLALHATDAERYERARVLAVLGRTSEGLAVLASSPSLSESLPAALLRGTIHETRREWTAELAALSRARELLEEQSPSPERDADLIHTVTGLAFAHRKLGDNPAAAAAYSELLRLSPTADTHFLLAQFYEDTQQGRPAQFHARQAMQLAPDRYTRPAGQLVNKLRTTHFTCWGLLNSDSP